MGLDCSKVFIRDFPRWGWCCNWSGIRRITPPLFQRLPNHHSLKEAVYRNLAGVDRLAHWQDSKYCLLCWASAGTRRLLQPLLWCLMHQYLLASGKEQLLPPLGSGSLTYFGCEQDDPKPYPNFTTLGLWYMFSIFINLRRGGRYVQFEWNPVE